MPNHSNILRPVLVLGCGRTASSYVLDRLQFGQGTFQQIIENDVYRDVYSALTDRWWCKRWPDVADATASRRRVLGATRQVLLTLFHGDARNWAMKMIWPKHDPEVVSALFPEARFLHLTRDPRTNVPSMIERLQFKPRHAETAYLESNATALLFGQFEGRYLRVKQEDLIATRTETWTGICTFLGVEAPAPERWERELNTSASTEGKVVNMRADSRLRWKKLRPEVRAMAEQLGYRE